MGRFPSRRGGPKGEKEMEDAYARLFFSFLVVTCLALGETDGDGAVSLGGGLHESAHDAVSLDSAGPGMRFQSEAKRRGGPLGASAAGGKPVAAGWYCTSTRRGTRTTRTTTRIAR